MDVVTQITDALLQETMPSRDGAMTLGEGKRRIEELTAELWPNEHRKGGCR